MFKASGKVKGTPGASYVTPTQLFSTNTYVPAVDMFEDGKALVVWFTGSALQAGVLTDTGSSISIGTPITVASTSAFWTLSPHACAMTSDTILFTYTNNATGGSYGTHVVVITISSSDGSPSVYSTTRVTTAASWSPVLCKVSDTQALLLYGDIAGGYSSQPYAMLLTLSGYNLSYGTGVNLYASSETVTTKSTNLVHMSGTKYMATYRNYVVCIDLTGETITYGTRTQIPSQYTGYSSQLRRLTDNKALLVYTPSTSTTTLLTSVAMLNSDDTIFLSSPTTLTTYADASYIGSRQLMIFDDYSIIQLTGDSSGSYWLTFSGTVFGTNMRPGVYSIVHNGRPTSSAICPFGTKKWLALFNTTALRLTGVVIKGV